MKTFIEHQLSIEDCRKELNDLEKLLNSATELSERSEILPFFRKNLHLSAFISTYVSNIVNPDRVAFEYDLFGDFACDLVVGDFSSHHFLLVEFEDAKKQSLFTETGKYTPEWSYRLEHGISQVIDWLWKLHDLEKSHDYAHRFGTGPAHFDGLVVVGRDENLSEREKLRLKWRQDRVVIDSKKVSVVTYDQLAADLKFRMLRYPQAAQAEVGAKRPTLNND